MSRDRAITLFLAGDVMTGRGVDQILPHPGDPELRELYVTSAVSYVELAELAHGRVPRPVDPSYPWGDGLLVLRRMKPELAIVNLETSITTSRDFWPDKAVHYRMHPANVECLRAAHLDVCTLANNHVMDFGTSGLIETLDVLRGAGIATTGAGRDLDEAARPVRVQLADGAALLVLGVGSVSSGIPGEWAAGPSRPGVLLLEELSPQVADDVAAHLRASAAPGDLPIVSIHWGSNWGHEIERDHVAFAHRLIEGGVHLVHGHSSHHVRAIEVYGGRLILYGCGDLITDYEGIGGHEAWRGDIGVMYFPAISARDGSLLGLRMVPVHMERLRLARVGRPDERWLVNTLGRVSRRFGSRFRWEDGEIALDLRDA